MRPIIIKHDKPTQHSLYILVIPKPVVKYEEKNANNERDDDDESVQYVEPFFWKAIP